MSSSETQRGGRYRWIMTGCCSSHSCQPSLTNLSRVASTAELVTARPRQIKPLRSAFKAPRLSITDMRENGAGDGNSRHLAWRSLPLSYTRAVGETIAPLVIDHYCQNQRPLGEGGFWVAKVAVRSRRNQPSAPSFRAGRSRILTISRRIFSAPTTAADIEVRATPPASRAMGSALSPLTSTSPLRRRMETAG